MNPVSLLAKNLIFTTLLVVMLYKVRKPGTLALFVLVNMLISMLLLGGSVTLLPAMLLAAGCGVNQLHHKVGGALCTLRRSGGSHRGSLVATRSLPACGGSSHGRSLVATSGSFAAGCGCLGRRSGLGLRLRGHQSLGFARARPSSQPA